MVSFVKKQTPIATRNFLSTGTKLPQGNHAMRQNYSYHQCPISRSEKSMSHKLVLASSVGVDPQINICDHSPITLPYTPYTIYRHLKLVDVWFRILSVAT